MTLNVAEEIFNTRRKIRSAGKVTDPNLEIVFSREGYSLYMASEEAQRFVYFRDTPPTVLGCPLRVDRTQAVKFKVVERRA